MITKTGIMVGVGENKADIFEFINDTVATKVDIITIGQYLTPSTAHYPIS
jgi:lipoic acid synthetase